MRRVAAAVVTAGAITGGLIGVLASVGLSTGAASSSGPRCPVGARVLPSDAVARAADQARMEARHLYRGMGAAVVTQSDRAPYAGARGSEARHQCGPRIFHRTVVVGLLFPKELPSASLSQGVVFVSLLPTGYRVWEVAH